MEYIIFAVEYSEKISHHIFIFQRNIFTGIMKLKPEDIETIILMRSQGIKVDTIAARFKVSRRRIFQVLKSGKIKKPGRKRMRVPEDVAKMILYFHRKGLSIDSIKRELEIRGIKISRYKVWTTIYEAKFEMFSTVCNDIYNKWKRIIIILILMIPYNRKFLRVLLVLDVKSCEVLNWELYPSIRLIDVIEVIRKSITQYKPEETVIFISRTPPLVPTRGKKNRLTRYLDSIGISYQWLPSSITKRARRELLKMIRSNLGNAGDADGIRRWISTEGIRLIEDKCHECKLLLKIKEAEVDEVS
ncbi:helix-turn-helix domain-containing protein [Thermococcus sp.]